MTVEDFVIMGCTRSVFPRKATGRRRSFLRKSLAASDWRRPPSVCRWSPSHMTNHFILAMTAASSRLPFCWLLSWRAKSASVIHWATELGTFYIQLRSVPYGDATAHLLSEGDVLSDDGAQELQKCKSSWGPTASGLRSAPLALLEGLL